MVSFEGSDVESLEGNFKAAVDEYLAFCKAEGKTRDAQFKGSFNTRISHSTSELRCMPKNTTSS